MDELIARLRAVSETGCDPDLPHEAADAIEVLARQTEEFEQLAVARGHTINGLRSELSAVKVERDALAAKLKGLEGQEPVAWRKRLEFEDGSEEWKFCAFPVLSKAEPLFASPAPAESSKWEGAEEWMPLAYHLCAEECGEDACHDLIWEGGPIPEPWGDRWMKYEDVAKDMIAAVRKFVPAEPVNARLVEALQRCEAAFDIYHSCFQVTGNETGMADAARYIAVVRSALAAAESQQTEPVRLTGDQLEGLVKWYGEEPNIYLDRREYARTIQDEVLRANGYKVEG